jgi:predicted HTH domain antitoxin
MNSSTRLFGANQPEQMLTIPYPAELHWALQQKPDEFANEARLLLAVKLYEMGRLSTGLAAQMAGMPRSVFIFLLGRFGVSPFGEDPDDLSEDLTNALRASYPQ